MVAEDKKKGKKPQRAESSPSSKATKKSKGPVSGPVSVPVAPAVPATPMLSGLDYVIKLDTAVEVAVQRASCRKRDPESGIVYHDVFNPAPTEVPFFFIIS